MSIFLIAVLLAANSLTSAPVVSSNVITVENDTITGVSLPAGQTVPLREQPRINPRDWVMIYPHEWIPLKAVCP